jgi:gamma-glutamylcysteine synthetase
MLILKSRTRKQMASIAAKVWRTQPSVREFSHDRMRAVLKPGLCPCTNTDHFDFIDLCSVEHAKDLAAQFDAEADRYRAAAVRLRAQIAEFEERGELWQT